MEGLLAEIIIRMGMFWQIFLDEPKVYFPLMGEWLLVLLYFMFSREKEDIADVYAAGVTLAFVGFELMPFHDIQFNDPTFYLSVGLMAWGVVLILLAAIKIVPAPIARLLGVPSATMMPALFIILAIETKLPMDLMTFGIVIVPAAFLEAIKLIFQMTGKH